ncbi:MAG: bifunctional adenosylcobinamide kinase/adenosylcobinamide-phosphate guanylyltransferase [Desulfosalsimonadaceae bacterium]
MGETTLVLGGCRSGKSSHALGLVQSRGGRHNCFIATCIARDEEMRNRVERHQAERGDCWHTVEAPLNLAKAVHEHAHSADAVLVDCLTLWVNNMLMEELNDTGVCERVEDLCAALDSAQSPVFLVSNEVGAGIVPENPLARRFRDLTGLANQRVAACVGQVIWMVAGIAVKIK